MSLTRAFNRRHFVMNSAVAAAASYPGLHRVLGRSDDIRLAAVGAGGRGEDNLRDLEECGVKVVALCDCDSARAAKPFQRYPDAKRYSDWRKLFEDDKEFDAVLVATPDHNHAIVSIQAMKKGKHVYCEKPLAHSIWEAREMARVAAEKRVVTQMGTQGHAFAGTRSAVEVIRSGVLGEIKELHVWTDRPAGWWPQGVSRPSELPAVPASLDWDVWLGPAPQRPYSPAYVPFVWRGFWDFGTGAIGDMGIHNLDTAYWGLELGLPTKVEIVDSFPGLKSPTIAETAPLWSIVNIWMSRKGHREPIRMTWYDGGKLPPKELFHGEPLGSKDGGSLVVGTKGTLYTRTWHGGQSDADRFILLPRKQFEGYREPNPMLPRPASHHLEFADAVRGKGKTESHFGYAARLTESLLVANAALRAGRGFEWDSRGMKAKGCPEADPFVKPQFRSGWGW